jgi:hypothetical protein
MKAVTFLMSILAVTVVVVDLSAEARSAKVDAAPAPTPTLVIRTYNYAALSAERLAAARSEAQHIFTSAGMSLEWIDCRVPGDDNGAACTEPLLAGRDLMLRLVDRTPATGERIGHPNAAAALGAPVVALGESMLDREQRGGVLMTVDLFPVRAVAARASTSLSMLLGRAVAHEIGHLLLGSAEHPQLGLMRALWSHDELRGLKPAHWGFSAREAAQMRQTRLRAGS